MKTILLILAVALACIAATAPAEFFEGVRYVASLLAAVAAFMGMAIGGAWTLHRLDRIQNLSRGQRAA